MSYKFFRLLETPVESKTDKTNVSRTPNLLTTSCLIINQANHSGLCNILGMIKSSMQYYTKPNVRGRMFLFSPLPCSHSVNRDSVDTHPVEGADVTGVLEEALYLVPYLPVIPTFLVRFVILSLCGCRGRERTEIKEGTRCWDEVRQHMPTMCGRS